MNALNKQITNKDVRDALKRSGYLLENRIANVLIKKNYVLSTNVAYPDPVTSKSREMDIFAKNYKLIGKTNHDLRCTLLIECINNLYPLAFICTEYAINLDYANLVEVSGYPMILNYKNRNLSLKNFLEFKKYHHYYKGKVSKQFCTFEVKKGKNEWMAIHYPDHLDTLTKLSNALTYNIDGHYNTILPIDVSSQKLKYEFYYLIIVLQNKMLEVIPKVRGFTIKNVNHIVFVSTTIENNMNYIQAYDIVTENYFPKYLEIISKEMDEIAKRINDDLPTFLYSFQFGLKPFENISDSNALKFIIDKDHYPISPNEKFNV